jgi:hypothetical protein
MRWIAGLLATGLAGFALAWSSAVPLPFRNPAEARLRLSWTARPERIETCRAASAEELARELEHMRQRVECEGRSATYALRVRVDDGPAVERVVRGGGFRHDRPMHLLEDFSIGSGVHRIALEFARRETETGSDTTVVAQRSTGTDTGLFAGRAERERTERSRRARAAIPARLTLDTTVAFAAGEVVLVTFDSERRSLVLRRGPAGTR